MQRLVHRPVCTLRRALPLALPASGAAQPTKYMHLADLKQQLHVEPECCAVEALDDNAILTVWNGA